MYQNMTVHTLFEQSHEEIFGSKDISQRIGSWEADLSKNSLKWSDETYRIFGYNPGEVEVTNEFFFSRVHPADLGAVLTASKAAIANGLPYQVDHRIIRKDGSTRIVHEEAHLVGGNSGVQLMVGTVHDITDRVASERQFRSLAAFPEYNPNPVLELSFDGVLNYANKAALDLAKSIGKSSIMDVLPQNYCAIIEECLLTGESRKRIEVQVEGRTISWSFFPILREKVVHSYAGDITEKKRLESELLHAQKMESIGKLAGGVAHDFNNILTVIQGHASLMLYAECTPEQMRESAHEIATAAERAANLTRQLLTFSRKQKIARQPLELNEVVEGTTKMLRRLVGEDVELKVSYGAHLPAVSADRGMVEQVMVNLAVNARDAMPKGGILTISTSYSHVIDNASIPSGEYVLLTFADTGCGIAPEHLPFIFEPFFTTKEQGRGTGLGLATVYGIVKQHEGYMNVTSEINQGTTFEVYLPANRMAKVEKRTIENPAITGGKETILVVEDETALRSLVSRVLEKYGYRVLQADSGVSALNLWKAHKDEVNLLLTDLVMPEGISGVELSDKLRSERPDLRIIYTSGYSEDVYKRDLAHTEGITFLQKPYPPSRLAELVRLSLDRD